MTKLRIRLLRDLAEFNLLDQEWTSFCSPLVDSNFCTSFHWLNSWCKYYLTPKDKLSIQLLYDQNLLVAILPFYIKDQGLIKELRFIGSGENEDVEVCSEFQDILIKPEYQQVVFKVMDEYFAAHAEFNQLCFEHYLPASNMHDWLTQSDVLQWKQADILTGLRYIIDINQSNEQQTKNIRSKTARRHAKKCLTNEQLSYKIASEGDFYDQFSELSKLHNAAWRGKGKSGAFSQQKFYQFHLCYARKAMKENKLLLFSLLYNNEVIAVYYGIADGNTLYYYQSGILPFDDIPSVGMAMHLTAIEIARDRGLALYDFMKGDKKSYKNKYRYSDIDVMTTLFTQFPYSLIRYFNIALQKLKSLVL